MKVGQGGVQAPLSLASKQGHVSRRRWRQRAVPPQAQGQRGGVQDTKYTCKSAHGGVWR